MYAIIEVTADDPVRDRFVKMVDSMVINLKVKVPCLNCGQLFGSHSYPEGCCPVTPRRAGDSKFEKTLKFKK